MQHSRTTKKCLDRKEKNGISEQPDFIGWEKQNGNSTCQRVADLKKFCTVFCTEESKFPVQLPKTNEHNSDSSSDKSLTPAVLRNISNRSHGKVDIHSQNDFVGWMEEDRSTNYERLEKLKKYCTIFCNDFNDQESTSEIDSESTCQRENKSTLRTHDPNYHSTIICKPNHESTITCEPNIMTCESDPNHESPRLCESPTHCEAKLILPCESDLESRLTTGELNYASVLTTRMKTSDIIGLLVKSEAESWNSPDSTSEVQHHYGLKSEVQNDYRSTCEVQNDYGSTTEVQNDYVSTTEVQNDHGSTSGNKTKSATSELDSDCVVHALQKYLSTEEKLKNLVVHLVRISENKSYEEDDWKEGFKGFKGKDVEENMEYVQKFNDCCDDFNDGVMDFKGWTMLEDSSQPLKKLKVALQSE